MPNDASATTAVTQDIAEGRTALGIELGSTRIKAVLISADHAPLATGGHEWENRLVDGLWTYPLVNVWSGVQAAFQAIADARYASGTRSSSPRSGRSASRR